MNLYNTKEMFSVVSKNAIKLGWERRCISYALCKRVVIDPNSRLLIQSMNGNIQTIDGPNSKILINKNYMQMERHVANTGDYLKVKYLNGKVEHKIGPVTEFLNPFEHQEILKCEPIRININSGLLVLDVNGIRIDNIVGPSFYIPKPEASMNFETQCYAPQENQYLIVNYCNGNIEHLRYPAQVYYNPQVHRWVKIINMHYIEPNSAVIVYSKGNNGEIKSRIENGPQYLFCEPNETYATLKSFVANDLQYLVVHMHNGSVVHINGPTMQYLNPDEHVKIEVQNCKRVESGEAVIVCTTVDDLMGNENGLVYKMVEGPVILFPEPNQIIEDLDKFVALDGQYLVVEYKNGKILHVKGPEIRWLIPDIKRIKVRDLIRLEKGQYAKVSMKKKDGSLLYRISEGPELVFPEPNEDVEILKNYIANSEEYLVIEYVDGRVECLSGPVFRYMLPQEHKEIRVISALKIDQNEAIVVYTNESRRVIKGPKVFVPKPDEWIHKFEWTGASAEERKSGKLSGNKVPNALHFTKLRLVAGHMYYDIPVARTSDDALLTLKFMIHYELKDIDKMLDTTHDPIAEMVNSVAADALKFTTVRNFEEFKRDNRNLNNLDEFCTLKLKAEQIGYEVGKIVFRGYESSDGIQKMHDSAMEERTQLKLQVETKRQAQDLLDMQLMRERERFESERELMKLKLGDELERKVVNAQNEMKIESDRIEQKLKIQEIEADLKRKIRKMERDDDLEYEKRKDNQDIDMRVKKQSLEGEYLKGLHEMGVDMTEYFTYEGKRPDKLIHIKRDPIPQSGSNMSTSPEGLIMT